MKYEDIAFELQALANNGYTVADISAEEYREVITKDMKFRIDAPIALIIRKGGSTHRVVDANGDVHCYVAPESGKSIITWRNKPNFPRIGF